MSSHNLTRERKICLLALCLLQFGIIIGCAGGGKLDAPSASARKCKKPNSTLNIVGGQSSSDTGVKMVLLYLKSRDFADRCTGVFISSTTLLTAGHCVLNREFGGDNHIGKAVLADTNESSTKITYHPKYTVGGGLSGLLQNGLDVAKASHSEYDIAVIEFEPRKRDIFKIGSQGKPGDKVTITGYGDTEQVTTKVRSDYKKMTPSAREAYMRKTFTLKVAQSQIALYDARGYFRLIWGKAGGQAFAAFGDSGGPLLNSNHETIGVTSCADPKNLIAGANSDILTGEWKNVYTDLNTQSSQEFLKTYLQNNQSDPIVGPSNDSTDNSGNSNHSSDQEKC